MERLTDSQRIKTFIEDKYPNATARKQFIYKLWENFQMYKLQDHHFVEEFTSGSHEKLLQRYTEMFFAWYFTELGFSATSQDEGPDLCLEHDNKRIWIEVVTPQLTLPQGTSPEAQSVARKISTYLKPLVLKPLEKGRRLIARPIPSEQILLRWTAALKEKHKKFKRYLDNNIIQPQDICVVALNSILLGCGGFEGISGLPNSVEATFAIGPIEIEIDNNTNEITDTRPSYRPSILKHNQSIVRADDFLNPDYKEVSALIAVHVDINLGDKCSSSSSSPLVIVHNPYATNSLPKQLFNAKEEYVAENKGDYWSISDVARYL